MFASRGFGHTSTSIRIHPIRNFVWSFVASYVGVLFIGVSAISVDEKPVASIGLAIVGTLILWLGGRVLLTSIRHMWRGVRTFFS